MMIFRECGSRREHRGHAWCDVITLPQWDAAPLATVVTLRPCSCPGVRARR